MKYRKIHGWSITPKAAISLQKALAKKIILDQKRPLKITKIAGVDVSFIGSKCCAAIVVLSYPDFRLLEQKTSLLKTPFPYVPGLLTFREAPAVLRCFKALKTVPDVVLFDGQGIAHPRKMGLAAHMGLWLNLPAIGCAKTPLFGEFKKPGKQKGAYSFINWKDSKIGAVVRTRDNVKPIYVSQGYKITLKDAIKISLKSCPKYRIPEPLRQAHTLSKSTLKSSL